MVAMAMYFYASRLTATAAKTPPQSANSNNQTSSSSNNCSSAGKRLQVQTAKAETAAGQQPSVSSEKSRPQTSVHDGCATLNGGLGRHSSSASSSGVHSDTAAETDNTLVYRDGILLSGPLSSLVQHLVPTTDYYPDQAYLFAFILSSRLFVKPHELLAKVVAVCHAQQRLGDQVSAALNPHHKDQLSRFVPRLVQLLAEWTDKFPYDFRDERVMAHVREITHQCVSVEPAVRHQVSAMLQTLLHRLTALDKYETFLQQTGTDATVGSADALSPNTLPRVYKAY